MKCSNQLYPQQGAKEVNDCERICNTSENVSAKSKKSFYWFIKLYLLSVVGLFAFSGLTHLLVAWLIRL